MRALVVGIDAACAEVLDPLFEAGRLPALRGLFEEGASGPLESHVPPWTPSMWPSIYTGVNPGKHGVFGFLSHEGYDWDVVDATDVHEHALWEVLDREGMTSVVVNVPVTHPPQAFDGALVPGYVAPDPPTCHPEGILEDVSAAIGREYRIYPARSDDREEKLGEYCDLVRSRGGAFRYLADEFDPDFGFVQFQSTDTVFHRHPGDEEMVGTIYETVDEEVAATLAATDPEAVFVVSDHGMGEYDGYGFRMNTFLAEHGYVETRDGGGGMPSWAPVRENRLREGRADDAGTGWLATGLDAATTVGITTRRIGAILERVGLHDAVAAHVPPELVRAGTRQVDFADSVAFMRARIELGVRINLEGREPEGVVSPDRYEAVRSELIELLSAVETPDGDPVFEEVVRREEYFEGPEAEAAVDIVTVPADFEHFLSADVREEVFGPPGQPWNHKRYGVFAAAGEAVDTDAVLGDAHVFDVAPTVLAALGVERSVRMDGEVLPVVAPVGACSRPPYAADDAGDRTGSDGGADGDDGAVAERLQNLGYIE